MNTRESGRRLEVIVEKYLRWCGYTTDRASARAGGRFQKRTDFLDGAADIIAVRPDSPVRLIQVSGNPAHRAQKRRKFEANTALVMCPHCSCEVWEHAAGANFRVFRAKVRPGDKVVWEEEDNHTNAVCADYPEEAA